MDTSVLLYSYSEKRPALAAAALFRMEGLDFSKRFSSHVSSPATESLANDNTIVFSVLYVLEYILGTWYLPGTGTATPNFDCTPQMVQRPKHSFCLRTRLESLFFLILNDLR